MSLEQSAGPDHDLDHPEVVTVITKSPMAQVEDGEFALIEEGQATEIPLSELRGEDLEHWINEEMPHTD